MEPKDAASEYQEMQWEKLKGIARRLETQPKQMRNTDRQTEKQVKEMKNLSETASK